MKIVAVGKSDIGKKRGHNEDSLVMDPELSLFVVCDGMGGHAAGDVASQTAARAVVESVRQRQGLLHAFDDSTESRDALVELVEEAVQDASRAVHRVAHSEQGRAGMGTTLTLVLFARGVGVMAHVGDTRLYLLRDGSIHQLSEDHTYVQEMVRRGIVTLEQAKGGPWANVITRAVGIQENVRVDTLLFDILAGDTLVLCSDGLSKYVDTNELPAFVGGKDLAAMSQTLIDTANERGGSDNVTAILMRAEMEPGDDDLFDRGRTTEVNLRIDTLQHVVIFRHLDMSEVYKVLGMVRPVDVNKGEMMIKEGDRSDALYIILDGALVVTRGGQPIVTLGPGEHFGEMALFNNRPRSATVTVATATARLLVIERERFNELVRKEPLLGTKMLWCLSQVLSARLDDATAALAGTERGSFESEVTSPFRERPTSSTQS